MNGLWLCMGFVFLLDWIVLCIIDLVLCSEPLELSCICVCRLCGLVYLPAVNQAGLAALVGCLAGWLSGCLAGRRDGVMVHRLWHNRLVH